MIGASGHAAVTADLAQQIGINIIGLVAKDDTSKAQFYKAFKIKDFGDDAALSKMDPTEFCLLNGIGIVPGNKVRQQVSMWFLDMGWTFSTMVHPSAVVSAHTEIASNTQIMAGGVVQARVTVGEGSIINTRASVDHDCRVGDYTHIAPGVTLCGSVVVGNRTLIGAGATVLPNLTIGSNAIVAAGSVVTRDVRENETYFNRNSPGRSE